MELTRRQLLKSLVASSGLLVASAAGAAQGDAFRTVDLDTVQKLLGAGDVRIYDVNPRDVYEKGHIPGAVFVGDAALSSLLPPDRATRLVFYCAGPR